ncbi:cyclase family protein [SAR202 cluster bacterium AD-802-E10_MRT_200m]|nr:cyclase family protein [SAR202 cluster bacterium AD-802-E10_MRT_200m]
MEIFDISLTIGPDIPTYKGDPGFKRRLVQTIDNGDVTDVSLLTFSAHIGTHVDAPSHLIQGGIPVDELNLETLIGPAYIVEFPGLGPIEEEFLASANIPEGQTRLIFKTRNSYLWDDPKFADQFVGLTPRAADWLVRKKFSLIGIDYLSVDAPAEPNLPVHRTLLSNGLIVVEGLNLSMVKEGPYHLICLPMKIGGSEGAPARVVLLKDKQFGIDNQQ